MLKTHQSAVYLILQGLFRAIYSIYIPKLHKLMVFTLILGTEGKLIHI